MNQSSNEAMPQEKNPSQKLRPLLYASAFLIVLATLISTLPIFFDQRFAQSSLFQSFLALTVSATLGVLLFGVLEGSEAFIQLEGGGRVVRLGGAVAATVVLYMLVAPQLNPTTNLAIQFNDSKNESVDHIENFRVRLIQESLNQSRPLNDSLGRVEFAFVPKGEKLRVELDTDEWKIINARASGGCDEIESERSPSGVTFESGCGNLVISIDDKEIDVRSIKLPLYRQTSPRVTLGRVLPALAIQVARAASTRRQSVTIRADLTMINSSLREREFKLSGGEIYNVPLCKTLDLLEDDFNKNSDPTEHIRILLRERKLQPVPLSSLDGEKNDECATVD